MAVVKRWSAERAERCQSMLTAIDAAPTNRHAAASTSLLVDQREGAHEFKGLASMTKSGTIVSRFSVTGHCDWLHLTFFVLSFRLSSRLVASESTSSKDSTVIELLPPTHCNDDPSCRRRGCLANLLIDLDLEPHLLSSVLLPSARSRRPPDGSRSRAKQSAWETSVIEYLYT